MPTPETEAGRQLLARKQRPSDEEVIAIETEAKRLALAELEARLGGIDLDALLAVRDAAIALDVAVGRGRHLEREKNRALGNLHAAVAARK